MLEHLRALREDRDLKQKDLAEFLNVHQSTYSDYELENISIPVETLRKLAIFYNTSIDYILDMTDIQKPYPRKEKRI